MVLNGDVRVVHLIPNFCYLGKQSRPKSDAEECVWSGSAPFANVLVQVFMKSLSRENQADIIEAFNSTSRYLDDLLNIDNIYFDQLVDRIYPTEL